MGWWEVTTRENTQLLMGDAPADALGKAFQEVIEIYQKEWGRKPTRAEMNYATQFVLRVVLDDLDTD